MEFGEGSNEAEGLIKLVEKFVTEPDRLLFIPGKGLIKLDLSRRKKSDFHRLSRYLAMIDS